MLIIKTILAKIEIHKSCYFFRFLAIITGSFHTVFLSVILLFGHECGHFFRAFFYKWKTDKITFYPFGGISKFYQDVNCPLKEELSVLLMGPIAQCAVYFFLSKLLTSSYQLILLKQIHITMLVFNLLPIYPLDGGRIIQVLFCYFLPFQLSYKIIFILSYFLLFCFLSFFLLYPNLNFLLAFLILGFRLLIERKKIKYYIERFFLERYLKKNSFKKSKIVKSEKAFYRDFFHILKKNHWYQLEDDYLKERYQNK